MTDLQGLGRELTREECLVEILMELRDIMDQNGFVQNYIEFDRARFAIAKYLKEEGLEDE